MTEALFVPTQGVLQLVRAFCGLDVGTTSTKAYVLSEDGKLLAIHRSSYPLHEPQPEHWELDPGEVLQAIQETVRHVARRCEEDGVSIESLAISALGEALLFLDKEGQPLTGSPVSMDYRGAPYMPVVEAAFGKSEIYRRTGQPLHPMYSVFKMAWMKEKQPDVYEKAVMICDWQGFLVGRLCGEYVTDRSLATRTLLYDADADRWWDEMLEFIGRGPEHVPQVMPSGKVAGRLTQEGAEFLGLKAGTPVVLGGWDQACAAFSAGVREGVLLDALGTTQALVTAVASEMLPAEMDDLGYQVTPGAREGERLLVGGSLSGALFVRWWTELCTSFGASADDLTPDRVLEEHGDSPSSIIALPYITGRGTPQVDTSPMGSLIGISYATDNADILTAIIDGVSYEVRCNIEALRATGVPVSQIYASGGPTYSTRWMQRKPDIYGLPVTAVTDPEGSARGAALLAGHGIGGLDADAIIQGDLKQCKVYRPDPAVMQQHEERFQIYRRLYPALRDAFRGGA